MWVRRSDYGSARTFNIEAVLPFRWRTLLHDLFLTLASGNDKTYRRETSDTKSSSSEYLEPWSFSSRFFGVISNEILSRVSAFAKYASTSFAVGRHEFQPKLGPSPYTHHAAVEEFEMIRGRYNNNVRGKGIYLEK